MKLLNRIKQAIVSILVGRELPMQSGEDRRTPPDTDEATMGRVAEDQAAIYLLINGYRILARDRENAIGELDIVARKNDTIAFIEVRSRSCGSSVHPRETLTRSKREKLVRTAQLFAKQHRLRRMRQRIDFIAVEFDEAGNPTVTDHLQNCVSADGSIA